MENVGQGNGCSSSQPTIGALRCSILAVLIGNPLFSKEEQLCANHDVHECEDAGRLIRWMHNVHLEIERREQVAEASACNAQKILYCGSDAPERELRYLTSCLSLTDVERFVAQIGLADASDSELSCVSYVGQVYVKALRRKGLLKEE